MTMQIHSNAERKDGETSGALRRLARWSEQHHWLAAALWLAVLAGVTVLSQAIGSQYHDDTSLPGTESQQVADIYARHAPARAGDSLYLLIEGRDDLRESATRTRVDRLLGELERMPGVSDVSDPYRERGSLSADGRFAYVSVNLDGKTADIPAGDVRAIAAKAQKASTDDMSIAAGGDPVRATEEGAGGGAEGAGMLAALVILVLMFGSVLAAGLPIITAVFAVGSTFGAMVLLSNLVDIASYTAPLMMLVGLGVGIDYALLVFSRYRSELLAGADTRLATVTALDTAGRSVVFAGSTVVIALLGLFLIGVGSLQGVALAVAFTVIMTMLASITLLPALLGILGPRIERQLRKRTARRRRQPGRGWERWAGVVERRPWLTLLGGTVVLAVLCLPALDMRLGFADAGAESPSLSSRRAYDGVAEGFGPGRNGPLVLVSRGDSSPQSDLVPALEGTRGVAAVTPPQPMGDSAYSALLVIPTTAPQAEETTDLVHRLRDDVLPATAARTGGEYVIGGSTAAAIDFSATVSQRLPVFVLVVVGLSMVLLMAVFRSLLIPVKAAVLNLLSIGAALGVMTFVFHQGHFGAQPGPIEAFVPVMIFAIVFGLSMDYEVFLLSRMHEEWKATGDAGHAVRRGLVATAGVITAAGAIMVVVFGAFLFSPDRMLQQFGLGLAVAVLLDAVVIRSLIVPSVMLLLGARAWWLPRWLGRVLPSVPLEAAESGDGTSVRPARKAPTG